MLTHTDCRNYAPVDAAKGICHRRKELLLGDEEHCEHFVATQKCKFCEHFIAGPPHLGTCDAAPARPMTYPELITVTCRDFARAPAGK